MNDDWNKDWIKQPDPFTPQIQQLARERDELERWIAGHKGLGPQGTKDAHVRIGRIDAQLEDLAAQRKAHERHQEPSRDEKERLRWEALTDEEKNTEAGARLPYRTHTYEELVALGRINPSR